MATQVHLCACGCIKAAHTTGAEVMKILGKPHERFHIIFQIFSLLLELNACMKNPRKLNISQPLPFNENVHNP